MSQVRVVSFLGQEYSFRISEDEELLFEQATALLRQKLQDAREQRAGGDAQQLLMTTALALCVSEIQLTAQLQQTDGYLAALVERLQAVVD